MKAIHWIPALLLVALPVRAAAAWVEDSVSVDVDTNDPKLIVTSLTQFQEMLNYLNAENLTSSSRVKIKNFSGRIARYHWENDSNCAVKDPTAIMPVEMSSSHTDYYYEANSKQVWGVDAVLAHPEPCSGTPGPRIARINSYRK